MKQLYQRKLLQEPRKYENVVMEDVKRELPLGKEKNSADSMHLAVCWSVDFVVRIYQGEGGIAAQNIQKLFGNAWNQRSMVKGFAQTVKEFQSRL